MFIAFEGLDGSGSSTQSKLLADKLETNKYATVLTKEPTSDSEIGKMIRDILQHKWEADSEALQLLFCADRAQHLHDTIEPALTNRQVVVTDRYALSTIAYGASEGIDIEWLKALNRSFRQPDITFLFRLDPKVCLERIQGRGTEFELFENQEKLEKIWENYEKLASEMENIHILDASLEIEAISEEIWGIVSKQLA